MKNQFTLFMLLFVITSFIISCNKEKEKSKNDETKKKQKTQIEKETFPQPVNLTNITSTGRLGYRALENFKRLERGRYVPDSIYIVPNPEYHQTRWPGDIPGRLVLGQTLLAQAISKKPKYLKQIIKEFPENMNSKGYFGKIYGNKINEQQLSGHGWALRGLCEYYEMTQKPEVLKMLKTMVDSLVLPTKGHHKNYPIEPKQREGAGDFMGQHQKEVGNWILSTDIGCDFIFMDGVVHAYEILKTPELKEISKEMLNRFMEVDLAAIEAQTHATLTALRAALRYYEMHPDPKLLKQVQERYDLYKNVASTENYENYNWFGRPRWTEPCAVIDSYIVAINLWRFTFKAQYLADAQLIYYNGIGVEQRYNGGFGCNTCTGTHDPVSNKFTDPFLKIATTESHWCCTMRGGEGLARAIEYSYFTQNDKIFIPDFKSNIAELEFGNKSVKIKQKTHYPFNDNVNIEVIESNLDFTPQLYIYVPPWMQKIQVSVNGKPYETIIENDYLVVREFLKKGNEIAISFDMLSFSKSTRNPNSISEYHSFWYGPLMLGKETDTEIDIPMSATITPIDSTNFKVEDTDLQLTTLNHLLNPNVTKENNYSMQVLFKDK